MMINETLRLIRVLHDMSATDLAKQLNISVSKLSKIENGNVMPNLDTIEKYAKLFNTTSASLLLFAENLDKDKNRGKIKISIRNKMFRLLQILGDYKDEKNTTKNTTRTKSSL